MKACSEEIYGKSTQGTWLQRYRWQYRSIFICLDVVASQIGEILQKFKVRAVQGHSMSSMLVSTKSAYVTSY